MTAFQIDGRDKLFSWLEHESDVEKRRLMLEWLASFAEDPLEHAHRIPGVRAPVYLVVTPVERWTMKFLYAEQFRTVKVIEFDQMP